MKIIEHTLTELSAKLAANEITSRELTEAYITQIETRDGEINAYVHRCFDMARQMADASDARRAAGKAIGPMDGIPMSMKDVVCTIEAPTTAASKILKGFQSNYDATLWAKLKAAGVVLLGKVNTDEFTMGSSTETSCYGVTKNPHNLERVSGGSSGGNAAAVAAHMCAGSIGTDTGGSIRQPAHFCGITGIKPSYGRVSRYGNIPMASSLDCPGPMAKTAADCAMILQVIAGHDPKDATTMEIEVPDYMSAITESISGMTFGVPAEYFIDGTSDDVTAVVSTGQQIVKDLGVTLQDVSLPHTKYAPAVYYVLAPSEISANMARYDGLRFGHTSEKNESLMEMYCNSRAEGLGDEVKRRIMIGTYALSAGYYDAYYKKAQSVRTLIKQDFEKVFETVDALICPVAPSAAFEIGSKTGDPVKMYLEDVFSIPASLAGLCAISVPIGQDKDGLPIGVQIICPAFKEERVLQIAHQIQLSLQK